MKNLQLSHQDHQPGKKKHPVSIIANNINSPENIGSIFRIADALGIERIYLSGSSAVPPNSKIRKTSRSAEKYVPFEYSEDPMEIISRLKVENYKIISLEITSSSIDLRKMPFNTNDKTCIILGSENQGITQELLDASDHTIHIPMSGHNSSMNVAVACSIACWEIIRRIQ